MPRIWCPLNGAASFLWAPCIQIGRSQKLKSFLLASESKAVTRLSTYYCYAGCGESSRNGTESVV